MKTFLRRFLWTVGTLLVLLPSLYVVENIRGRRAWTAWVKACEAAGDRMDVAAYVPRIVPEEDNFLAAPGVAEAVRGRASLLNLPAQWPAGEDRSDWRRGQRTSLEAYRKAFPEGDVSRGLEAYWEPLGQWAKASERRGSHLPKEMYERYPEGDFPAMLGFRAAARLLRLRALAHLQAARNGEALHDTLALLRIGRHIEEEPILLCQLLRIFMGNLTMQPVWEGLSRRAWTDAQLQALEAELARADMIHAMERCWRFEQAGMAGLWTRQADQAPWSLASLPSWTVAESPRPSSDILEVGSGRGRVIPRGWYLQHAWRQGRALRAVTLGPLRPGDRTIDPFAQDQAISEGLAWTKATRTPYNFIPLWREFSPIPALAQQNLRVARLQVAIDHARIACALERFRMRWKRYPDRVEELGSGLPKDLIGGRPYGYRRTDRGYLLYSVGWNGSDEGGLPGRWEDYPDSLRNGDWVWELTGQRERD